MSQKIIIREAENKDRNAIADVLLDAYHQYSEIMPEPLWLEYRKSLLDSVHGDAPLVRIIAEIDRKIVGSALLFSSSETAYGKPELGIHSPILRLLAVSPSARGLGVATLLIHEAAQRSLQLGATTLNLHTSEMMSSAIKLYQRLGFNRAYETDLMNGDTLVQSFRLDLLSSVRSTAGQL
ncbi:MULTISPECIES: GNAT family N-acetyltransferase [Paenibacillus]|uniref:GNAT family N-acetyltransferase n=1 Tax=Paenibacillus TaxID=44249 RepID=UPI00096F6893|nr:GNAT family N-acetyltransferase [Paenibacillus odorifer]OMD15182.1 GNAT family N-acetyltransferase [Paenibacillus odorifer]OZQ79781.1 GNAT family N-acetyltransferase [Paenibacillus odorifer]